MPSAFPGGIYFPTFACSRNLELNNVYAKQIAAGTHLFKIIRVAAGLLNFFAIIIFLLLFLTGKITYFYVLLYNCNSFIFILQSSA